jgi:hypothetical protein
MRIRMYRRNIGRERQELTAALVAVKSRSSETRALCERARAELHGRLEELKNLSERIARLALAPTFVVPQGLRAAAPPPLRG